FTLECVLRTFWDCKLELNFVPVYRAVAFGEGGPKIGNKIEFFCLLKCASTAGSLTSTYRVVRNTTLRAESEIKHRRTTMREFQLSQISWSRSRGTRTD